MISADRVERELSSHYSGSTEFFGLLFGLGLSLTLSAGVAVGGCYLVLRKALAWLVAEQWLQSSGDGGYRISPARLNSLLN